MLSTIYAYLLAWLPSYMAIVFLGLFTVFIILLVLRIVKIILDSLPFL